VIHVLIILVALLVVFLGTSIWAIIDAASKPREAFVAVGDSKAMWITLIAVFTLSLGIAGFILALVYLISIRPKINNRTGETWAKPPPVASRRPWIYFALWMLVGGAYAMVIAAAFTIGIFFIPFAVIATVLLVRKPSSRRGIPGLFAGVALPLFYVAFLNRSGPGMVCTMTRSTFGVGQSCTQEWSPWLWLSAGLVLLGAGVALFIVTLRSSKRQRCSQCAQSLSPGARFCTHCGTRSDEFTEAL
jgi:hypothetical protein